MPGPRGVRQGAEEVENGPLTPLGAKLAGRSDVLEGRVIVLGKEKREMLFPQRARGCCRRQVDADAERFEDIRAACLRSDGPVAVLGHGDPG